MGENYATEKNWTGKPNADAVNGRCEQTKGAVVLQIRLVCMRLFTLSVKRAKFAYSSGTLHCTGKTTCEGSLKCLHQCHCQVLHAQEREDCCEGLWFVSFSSLLLVRGCWRVLLFFFFALSKSRMCFSLCGS